MAVAVLPLRPLKALTEVRAVAVERLAVEVVQEQGDWEHLVKVTLEVAV